MMTKEIKNELLYKFTFGKYKGLSFLQVLNKDPRYLLWVSSNVHYVNVPNHILQDARSCIEEEMFDEQMDFCNG